MNALIVEDDDLLAEGLLRKLERRGWSVSVVTNQRAALHALDRAPPDVVLLDLRLPTDDEDMYPHVEVGFDILDHIRRRFSQSRLPVIVMTAHEHTSQLAVRAFKSLANDYITKPFSECDISLDEKLDGVTASLVADRTAETDGRCPVVFTRTEVTIGVHVVSNDRHASLLRILAGQTLYVNTSASAPRTRSGRHLAKVLDVQPATMRRYVTRLNLAARAAAGSGARELICNDRSGQGYYINLADYVIRSP